MLHQAALDLGGTNARAGALADIVRAPLVPEIAVGVGLALVAGAAPVADELVARGLRVLPVLEEEHRIILPVHGDLAQLAGRQLLALVVDHRDAMPRIRPSDRAGLHRPAGLPFPPHVLDLALPDHLVDRHAEPPLAP